MSHIVGGESGSARRNRKLREIATALRHAAEANPGPEESHQLIEFILDALRDIDETVRQATTAWERRNYWVKADRFRHTWSWVSDAAAGLERALDAGNEDAARSIALGLTGPMKEVKPYKSRHRRPWNGAWKAGVHDQGGDGSGGLAPRRRAEDNGASG